MLRGPLGVGDPRGVLLQQLLVQRVELQLVLVGVHVGVDQVDGDPEVVLRQQLVLVVPLQTGRVVRNKPLRVKWVCQELWIKRLN